MKPFQRTEGKMSWTQEPKMPRYLARSFLLIGIALWPMANALADRAPTAEQRVTSLKIIKRERDD